MDKQTVTFVVAGLTFLAIVLLILVLIRRYKSSKQPYGSSELVGLRTKIWDVMDFKMVNGKPDAETQKAIDLLNWWKTWRQGIDPTILSTIYTTCPDLETDMAIRTYGLTKIMVEMLNKLKPTLSKVKNSQLKTLDDVQKHFNSCISSGLKEIGAPPGSTEGNWGIYNFVI